jgi:hypothetical protein
MLQLAYPVIEGTDHRLLLSYYNVLRTIAEDFTCYNLTPSEHIKLIEKVKSASSGKNESCSFLKYYGACSEIKCTEVLTAGGIFSNMLTTLPCSLPSAMRLVRGQHIENTRRDNKFCEKCQSKLPLSAK